MTACTPAGGRPPAAAGLTAEVACRATEVCRVMARHDVDALVVVCAGAPHARGWMRYLTGANIWGPRVFLVIRGDGGDATVVTRSPDDAEWLARTVLGASVESTLLQRVPPVRRVVDMLADIGPRGGRIGFINQASLTVDEAEVLREVVPEAGWLDLTDELDRVRQVKSPFEVAAMRETGGLLARALDIVGEWAAPGERLLEVLGDVEAFLRGAGCEHGRIDVAFDGAAFPTAVSVARRLGPGDVLQVRLKYAGPLGYWHELAGVFAFRPMAPRLSAHLRASVDAFDEAVRHLTPGTPARRLGAAADAILAARGFAVVGRHRRDCHPIGTDESEGRLPPVGDWDVREGMAVAVHPGALLTDETGFSLDRTFLVEAAGPVALSPSRPVPWRAA